MADIIAPSPAAGQDGGTPAAPAAPAAPAVTPAAPTESRSEALARIATEAHAAAQPAPVPEATPPAPDEEEKPVQPEVEAGAEAAEPEAGAEPPAEAAAGEEDALEAGPDGNVPVRESRWKRSIHPGYKFAKELAQTLHGTDIQSLDASMLPAIEDVKTWHESYVNQQMLQSELSTGNPAKVMEVLGDGADEFAKNFMPHLASTNPQAYQAVARPQVEGFLKHLLSTADAAPSPEDAESIRHAVDIGFHRLTGGQWWPRKGQQPQQTDANGQPFVNPQLDAQMRELQQRQAAIDAREREFQQAQVEQARAVEAQRNAAHTQSLNAEVSTAVDEALAPLGGTLDELYLGGTKQQMFSEAIETMKKNSNYKLFDSNFARAVKSGDPAEFETAKNQFKSMLAIAINSLTPRYLKGANKTVSAASKEKHEKLRQASEHRAPVPRGGTATGANGPIDLSQIKGRKAKIAALFGDLRSG